MHVAETKKTMEAVKSVAEEPQKWEEAKRHSEETEKTSCRQLKGAGSMTREMCSNPNVGRSDEDDGRNKTDNRGREVCVEEENLKCEEAKKKTDEMEQGIMSTTKRAESMAREAGKFILRVAQGNPIGSTAKNSIMENMGICRQSGGSNAERHGVDPSRKQTHSCRL